MTCWAIIPCKPASESKRRLAGALDPQARSGLVEAMLAHVADAAARAEGIDRVCLVGPTRGGLPETLALLPDPGRGLNAAVASALAEAGRAGVSRVVIVHGDLPNVTPQEIARLAAAPPDAIAIAPDRHGTGTNALSLPLPAARDFSFAFGPGSFARHRAEVERLGLELHVLRSPGLEQDIDEPADLRDIPALLHQPG